MINRNYSSDLLKAISIIGVVFIHGATLFGKNSDFVLHCANMFRFSVPCFIILWAYYFEKAFAKKDSIEMKNYTKKQLLHLFKVFIIWSFIYFAITAKWESLTFKKIITSYFSGYGWSGQYFFIILFQLILLYPVLRKIYFIKTIRVILLLTTAAIYIICGYFNDFIPDVLLKMSNRLFIYWVPYVFVGISLAINELKKVQLYFALSLTFIAIEFSYLKNFKMIHDPYLTPSVILASVLFFLSIFKNEFIARIEIFKRVIHYIGSNTMTIFIANPLVIIILKLITPSCVFQFTKNLGVVFSSVVSTTIILLFCLLISEFIKKIKLTGHLN